MIRLITLANTYFASQVAIWTTYLGMGMSFDDQTCTGIILRNEAVFNEGKNRVRVESFQVAYVVIKTVSSLL